MELESTKAVVLQVIDYSDSKIIVHVYTSDHGRMGFIASKRTKLVKNKVLFQPLFLLEIAFYPNRISDLHRIKSVQLWKPFNDIPFNHGKMFINLFLSELLTKTLNEQIANVALFNYIVNSLELFDRSPANWNCFHLGFMAHLSKYLGFFPTFGFNAYKNCNSADSEILLKKLKETPITEFSLLRFTREQRQVVLNHLLTYYQLHLPIGELYSNRVLQQF